MKDDKLEAVICFIFVALSSRNYSTEIKNSFYKFRKAAIKKTNKEKTETIDRFINA